MKTVNLFLDSINGNKARLLFGSEEFVVPKALLPKDAREGDWLTASFEIDRKKTETAKKECEELLKELCGNNTN